MVKNELDKKIDREEKGGKLNVLIMEGLAIFFVMLVHSGTPNYIYSFFSYGLSSLIFARGYQWKEKSLDKFILSRIQLIKTYYFAGLINSLIFLLIVPEKFITTSRWKYLVNFLIGRLDKLSEIPINIVPLWFFLMLFFAEIFYLILSKNKIALYIAIVFSILIRITPHTPLPFKIDAALCSIPFFYIGKKWKEMNIKISFPFFLLSTFGLFLISRYNGDISWNTQWFGKNGLIAFLGEILAIFVVIYLSEFIKNSIFEGFFYKLAFNSLFVISYHFLFGSILYYPFSLLLGPIENPMELLHKFWFIHFAAVITMVLLSINFIPRKIRNFFIGNFDDFTKRKGRRSV